MVKRVKRASAVVFDHPTPPSYQPLAENHSRVRLKIQSLQDDYEELAKENDAMKRRLQMAKNQKRILSSQVRFLREKYMLLRENPRNPTFRPPRPEEGHRTMTSRHNKPPVGSKPDRHRSYHTTTHHHAQHPAGIDMNHHHHAQHTTGIDINHHAQHTTGIDINHHHHAQPTTGIDINHHHYPSMRMDKPNTTTTNNTEHFASTSNATTGRKKILALDLNETTPPQFMDEPNEYNPNSWSTNPPSATWDRQLQLHPRASEPDSAGAADLKLAVCRNVGKDAAARAAGKRKITWQDQVALRV